MPDLVTSQLQLIAFAGALEIVALAAQRENYGKWMS
jgi:hypothetical protein